MDYRFLMKWLPATPKDAEASPSAQGMVAKEPYLRSLPDGRMVFSEDYERELNRYEEERAEN